MTFRGGSRFGKETHQRECDSHHLLSSHSVSGHMDQVDVMLARFSRHTYTVGYCCHLEDSADPELKLHRAVIQPLAALSRSPAGFRRGEGAVWPSLLSSGEGTVAERQVRPLFEEFRNQSIWKCLGAVRAGSWPCSSGHVARISIHTSAPRPSP